MLYPLSYEGNRASAAEALAGREGFEPSVEDLNPRQALSRRPRSANSGTSPEGSQAEGEGFEPPVGCPTAVLKTAAFVRSAIPPGAKNPSRKRDFTTGTKQKPGFCKKPGFYARHT